MKDYYPPLYWQAKEQLVKEIADAQRWSTVEEAIKALYKVNYMGNQMANEAEHLDPNKNIGGLSSQSK